MPPALILAAAFDFALGDVSGTTVAAFAGNPAGPEFPVLLAILPPIGAAGSQLVFRKTASGGQEPAAVST